MTTEKAKTAIKAAVQNIAKPRTKLQVIIGDTVAGILLIGYLFFRDRFPAFGDTPVIGAIMVYLTSRLWGKPNKE